MRLNRLDFVRYGHFEGSSIELPRLPRDLHIVVGPNESGKSTARSAISDLLFGFGAKTRYAFQHEMTALRVGSEIELGDERLSFRRRKGTKGTLLDEADRALGDNALAPYLAGADRAYFERMFSLDQPSLVAGAESMLDSSDDVARMLFQASAGLSGLGDVLKGLEEEAGRLWAPRKSRDREYYKALEAYEAAERAMKEATVRSADWDKARKALEKAKQQLDEAVSAHAQADRERARLARISRTAPMLRELRDLSAQLQEAGEIILLPEDSEQVWSDATRAIALAKQRKEDLSREIEEARAQLETLVVDEPILARSPAILAVLKEQAATSRHPIDLEKRRAELSRLEDDARKRAQALGWKPASIEDIVARMPPELLLRRLTDLAGAAGSLRLKHETAERALAEARRKHGALAAERDRLNDEGAPAPLRDALSQARALGDTDARRGELSSALAKVESKLDRMQSALRPFVGSIDALKLVLPPDAIVVGRFHRELANRAEQLRQLASERAGLHQALEEVRLRERQIQREAAPVGPDEVAEARARREDAWQAAKQQLVHPRSDANPALLANEVESTMLAADALADRRCDAIGAWAELQTIRHQQELLETKLRALDSKLATLRAEQEEQQRAWRDLLATSGLPQMEPEQVPHWAKRRDDALDEAEATRLARERLAAFDAAEAKAVEQLRSALLGAGESETELRGLAFAALLGRAEALAKTRDEERARRGQMTEQLSRAERELESLDEQFRRTSEALSAWGEQWQRALIEAGLPSSLEPAEGAAVVDSLRELERKLAEIAELRNKRIETMERDLAALRDSALAIARDVASELLELPLGELIDTLAQRLDRAKKTRELRERATSRIEELERKLASAIEEHRQADARLVPLYGLAKADSSEGLFEAIQRSSWRRNLEKEIRMREQALRQSGDGLPRASLEAEADAEDLTTLPTRLEAVKEEFQRLGELRQMYAVEVQNAQRAFDAIAGGEQAANAAGERQQALAAMSAAVERWIRIRTAAKTLRWAIERFRQQKQDPLLARAGEIFATLTLGELERLAVDFDEKDQPRLVGIRRGTGGQVPIEGMSTGTADQLYLALRIAALELHLESRPALPFVADDIFIHFDDERAAAGFRVLADLSRRTQVIFFTHHEHLVDVARKATGGELASVVRLGS